VERPFRLPRRRPCRRASKNAGKNTGMAGGDARSTVLCIMDIGILECDD